MSKINVLDGSGDKIGSYPTVSKAVKAVENYFQCGVVETPAEAKNQIKYTGSAMIFHCLDGSLKCWIEAA